jgi:hypothetical protein
MLSTIVNVVLEMAVDVVYIKPVQTRLIQSIIPALLTTTKDFLPTGSI